MSYAVLTAGLAHSRAIVNNLMIDRWSGFERDEEEMMGNVLEQRPRLPLYVFVKRGESVEGICFVMGEKRG